MMKKIKLEGIKLAIAIPCFNEKNRIQEISIVDDRSPDETREILQQPIEPLVDKIIYQLK